MSTFMMTASTYGGLSVPKPPAAGSPHDWPVLEDWPLSKEETVGRLMGKTAVISGVASGIGALAWRRFCEEGASVVGIDINESAGKQLADELRANGHDGEFFTADVTSKEAIDSLAALIRDRFGGLDILYNNAGINLARPLLETTEAEWDNVHNVDLKSTFLMMKAFAPLMQDRPASIINTASMGGLVAYDNMAAYCAAKGGLIMLTKAAALELAPAVRVNVICPTLIDTPMSRRFVGDLPLEFDQVWKAFEGGHPLGRIGKPEDVVPLAVYLASDESLMMTGVALPVDGGWSIR